MEAAFWVAGAKAAAPARREANTASFMVFFEILWRQENPKNVRTADVFRERVGIRIFGFDPPKD